MKDEEYVFMQDIKEKKSIARGAFHKKGGSKSKKCTLPSDYLTRKEREKMNGEVKRWNMNEFYTWNEFKEMPKDIAAAYISTLNQKYRVSMMNIAEKLFHVAKPTFSTYIKKSGIRDLLKIQMYNNRGEHNRNLVEFENAIIAEKVAKETVPADIFIPAGMAPGYCSDGTKVEDAIKEAADKANKKLLEDNQVSAYDVIADIHKEIGVSDPENTLDFSHNPKGEFISLPCTCGCPDDEPEKERPAISSLSFVMHGVDRERIAGILSWFDGKDVTITLNITEKM